MGELYKKTQANADGEFKDVSGNGHHAKRTGGDGEVVDVGNTLYALDCSKGNNAKWETDKDTAFLGSNDV